MRPGTPAFVGARLREGREARGLTAAALAGAIGVSRQAISQYEHGSVTPCPEVMGKIVSTLDLPYEFFWQPARLACKKVYCSSSGNVAKVIRMRRNWRLKWLKDICHYLQRFVEFPAVNMPVFDPPGKLGDISGDMIEELAREVRRYWRLGTGVTGNVVRLLEKNGVVVAWEQTGYRSTGAFSNWEEGQRPCMVLGDGTAARLRFAAGHQLGHLLLHSNIDQDTLCRPEEFKLAQEQAGHFASAFLLPKETFIKDCGRVTLESLRILKAKWKLSIAMMIQRARQIGLCSEDQARQLWKSYNRRGWKEKEPLDDELQFEKPNLLRMSFELIVEKDIQTCHEILSNLTLARTDIEELAGLPRGYLEDAPLKINLSPGVSGTGGQFTPAAPVQS